VSEQWVACPGCRENIRLTEEELETARGFCAICEARFDVTADVVSGEGPFRVAEAALALVPTTPPSGRIAVRETDGGSEIAIRPGPMPARLVFRAASAAPALVVPIVAPMLGFSPFVVVFMGVVLIPVCVFNYPTARRYLRAIAREKLTVDAHGFVIERRILGWPRRRRIAFADVQKAQVVDRPPDIQFYASWSKKEEEPPIPHAELVLRGGETIVLAHGMHHDRVTLEWIVATIERAARRARAGQAEAPALRAGGGA
jgi:hypothetical protein